MKRSYRFLRAPLHVIKRGHIFYLLYLGIIAGMIGVVAPPLHRLLLDQGAKLLAGQMMSWEQIVLLRRFIGFLIVLLASPVVLAAFTLIVGDRSATGFRAVQALIQRTPQAIAIAGAALVALFFRSFKLLIPLFVIFVSYLIIEEMFKLGDREFLGALIITAICVSPFLWRAGVLVTAPLVGVLGNVGGKKVLAESYRVMRGHEFEVWLLVLGGTTGAVSFIALIAVLGVILPQPLHVGILSALGAYTLIALSALVEAALRSVEATPQVTRSNSPLNPRS